MEKQEMSERIERRPQTRLTLEEKINAVLDDGKVASHDLEVLIAEVEAGIEAADKAAKEQRQRSLDLTVTTDVASAHEAVGIAVLVRDRLQTILPRLEQKLADALAQEYADRWAADFGRVEARVAEAAKRFARYPALVAELVAILDTEEIDGEVSRVNGQAFAGESRRLRGVELTARGLGGFSRDEPSIAKTTHLIDWSTGREVWPPPEPAFGAAFVQSMVSSLSAGIGPVGPGWELPEIRERVAAERAAEREKLAKHYTEMTRTQEQRNREEHERADQARQRGA
jgi:hypothetical protein